MAAEGVGEYVVVVDIVRSVLVVVVGTGAGDKTELTRRNFSLPRPRAACIFLPMLFPRCLVCFGVKC